MAKTKTAEEPVQEQQTGGAIVPVQQVPHWSSPRSLGEAMQLAEMMAKGGVLPDVRNAGQALLKIMVGAELGFGPSASLIGVHIVEGRPSVGAHLIAAAIRRSGRYDYALIEGTALRCEVQFFRLAGGKRELLGTENMSMQEAIDTGLALGKDGKLKANYARSGSDMLFARVITRGFRRHCPDLIGGAVIYDPDELDTPAIVTVQSPSPALPVAPAAVVTPPAAVSLDEVQDAEVVPAEGKPQAAQTGSPLMCCEEQVVQFDQLVRDLSLTHTQIVAALAKRGVKSFRELTAPQAAEVVQALTTRLAQVQAQATAQAG